jgi:VWFA-related protein
MTTRIFPAVAPVVRVALVAMLSAASLQAQQPPRFQSSVDVTSVDAVVLDDRGRPLSDLQPSDFAVRVDGTPRRVVSVEWVPLSSGAAKEAPKPPEGYSSNQNATGGRLILIVVDQPNIRFGAAQIITNAVEAFIDKLEPSDRIAAVGLGPGGASTPFTSDRALVKRAIGRMNGQAHTQPMALVYIGIGEAIEIANGSDLTFRSVVGRECTPQMTGDPMACQIEVQAQASSIAVQAQADTAESLASMRRLLEGLKRIDAPKTVLFISEGFPLVGRDADVLSLGALAAQARTGIFAIKLDDRSAVDASVERRSAMMTMNERRTRGEGLDMLVQSSRGSLLNVISNGKVALDQIANELSGYYLLGLESDPKDRDGKPHRMRVEVSRRGATVRSRREFLLSTTEAPPPSPREAVFAGLASPLLMSALPLRVTTFALQGPEAAKIQILIHADVGTDYASAKRVTLGYYITNARGSVVDSQMANARLPPVMNGVPSPLQFVGGSSLEPGDYTLKLSVAEGDRLGTIEHPIHARLDDAGQFLVSGLIVGGPLGTGEKIHPTVGYEIVFGSVHAYMEAYGPGVESVKVGYEIAADADGPALLNAEAGRLMAGGSRAIFTNILPVRQLPPGKYVLRAIVTEADRTIKTTTRSFAVGTPAVLMTSAENTGPPVVAPADLFLPVEDRLLQRPFDPSRAWRPETLNAFRERVPAAARADFDRGAAWLKAGNYPKAEESFKIAIEQDADNSAVLALLAATFAASGHDAEAASAWQTSLIDGSELPDSYEWLGDGLIRTHQYVEAMSILEEAVSKWPADPRFAKPLALLYATFGQGREALRTLERHLASSPDDPDALYLGVEWIYQLRAAGAVAHSPADDLKLARLWADGYAKAKGPQTALVRQWVTALESHSP